MTMKILRFEQLSDPNRIEVVVHADTDKWIPDPRYVVAHEWPVELPSHLAEIERENNHPEMSDEQWEKYTQTTAWKKHAQELWHEHIKAEMRNYAEAAIARQSPAVRKLAAEGEEL